MKTNFRNQRARLGMVKNEETERKVDTVKAVRHNVKFGQFFFDLHAVFPFTINDMKILSTLSGEVELQVFNYGSAVGGFTVSVEADKATNVEPFELLRGQTLHMFFRGGDGKEKATVTITCEKVYA